MVSKEMALKLKEIGLEWEPQRHDMYLRIYNQGCPMQPRCDINEVLSALPELIEREREAEKLIAAAEQRAEQLRNIRNAAEKLMKNICSYCPPWYREDISKCAKWCEMREKYELRQALAQAERGQE
jgi:hypothetical protein